MKRVVSFLVALVFLSSFALSLLPALPSKAADATYEQSLRNAGFPESYVMKLSLLHDIHPNWIFKPVLVTNMNSKYTWDYVIEQEMSPERNLIYKSYPWEDYATSPDLLESGLWRQASEATVEFFMDPRNFLDERNIFMFETLRADSAVYTLSDIQYALSNSFMANATLENGKTYAQHFYDLGESIGVSALHLATRIRQEQGTAGTSPLISGKCGDTLWSYYINGSNGAPTAGYTEAELKAYNGYYNYFNIGASGTGYFNIYLSGMKEAKEGGWTTRYAAIQGGAQKIYNNYVSDYQHTLYFQKFNVHPSSGRNFWGQYMQNVSAPYSEGRAIQKTYADNGILNSAFTFEIPVYSGMPGTCPDPGNSFEASTNTGASKNVSSISEFSYDTGIINKLTQDISGGITVDGRFLIVDLNGHKWSNNSSAITLDIGSVSVYDSASGGRIETSAGDAISMGNGTASFRNVTIKANQDGMDAIYCDGGNLSVTNCTLSAPKAGINISNGSESVDSSARSIVLVNGGRFDSFSGTLDSRGRNCAIEIKNNADEITLMGDIVFTNNKIISKNANSKAIKDAITLGSGASATYTSGANVEDYKTATISYTNSGSGSVTTNNVSSISSFQYSENVVNKLTADISGYVHLQGENLVVDLAGHKWTNGGNAVVLETGNIHIYDSVGGGSIVTTAGDAINMGNGTAIFDDITITAGGDGMDAICCNGGNLTVNNCTLSAPKAGINVSNSSEASDVSARSVVSVNGGKFAKYTGSLDSKGRNCAIEIKNNADEITLSGNISFINNVIISSNTNTKTIKNAITIGANCTATFTDKSPISTYNVATISFQSTSTPSVDDNMSWLDIAALPSSGKFTAAGYGNSEYLLNFGSGGENSREKHSIGIIDLAKVKKFVIYYGNDPHVTSLGMLVLKTSEGQNLATAILTKTATSWTNCVSAEIDVSSLKNNEELYLEHSGGLGGIAVSKIGIVEMGENDYDGIPEWNCDFQNNFYESVADTSWAFSSGASEDGNILRNIWKFSLGMSGPTGIIESGLANSDGNYLVIGGINAMPSNKSWNDDWSFTADINIDEGSNAGNVLLFNYDFDTTTNNSTYKIYEATPGYADAQKPARYVGNSGIGVSLYTTNSNDIMCIYVLTADYSGQFSHIEYEVKLAKGTFSGNGWANLSVTEIGETFYITLDDNLVSYIKYSSPRTTPVMEIICECYQNATIYSANNSVVASTSNALISVDSTMGLAARAGLINIDNIVLGEAKEIFEAKPGDVNGDGSVTPMDATLIRRYSAGFGNTIDLVAADVNNDGSVTAMDATLIRRYNAGFGNTLI